jgi:hypothetical protein
MREFSQWKNRSGRVKDMCVCVFLYLSIHICACVSLSPSHSFCNSVCVCLVEDNGSKGTIGSDTNPKISRFKMEKIEIQSNFFSLKARPDW